MDLAAAYGLTEYSAPAGGCLLTMEDFVRKVEFLIRNRPDFGRPEIEFIKRGRHFALSERALLAMGKNDAENQALAESAGENDLIITTDAPGPLGLVRGAPDAEDLELAMALMGRYMKKLTPETVFEARDKNGGLVKTAHARALDPNEADELRI
jgi:hypothetical protein